MAKNAYRHPCEFSFKEDLIILEFADGKKLKVETLHILLDRHEGLVRCGPAEAVTSYLAALRASLEMCDEPDRGDLVEEKILPSETAVTRLNLLLKSPDYAMEEAARLILAVA